MKSFAELFKRYRLRAEFETFSSFSEALGQKGFYYEESIFSHWQKGTRIPTNRIVILKMIELFQERNALSTLSQANEFLSSVGLGFLTDKEEKELGFKKAYASKEQKTNNSISQKLVWFVIFITLFSLASLLYYLTRPNYITSFPTVSSVVTEPKKLVVGIDATLPPMEYIESNKMIGYDVDLANALARELDAEIEFRKINFDDLFSTLEQRRINMIISAVTITKEREQKYSFSNGYLNAGQVIITHKTNNSIHTVKDLKGKRIATQTGTTNEQEALKHTADNLVFRYRSFEDATRALKEGKVDAVFTDLPNAKGILAKNAELKIVGTPFTKEYYGIVFLKSDPSVTQINEALESLRKKGILTNLEKKWLLY